ncbi:MAG: hypothetical protein DLM50_03845 [Candidatus Meridianibacter frigidus]|nr:MAG: hypothetical protein DLM50_03845 [Candidatus Eremiobacteraeota bacterium]
MQSQDAPAVWKHLVEGNGRFVDGRMTHFDPKVERRNSARNPTPRAIVLTCADPRVVPEYIFDLPPGTLFTIRNAGAGVDTSVVAACDFGLELFRTPLIVVMAHTRCAALLAAESSDRFPALSETTQGERSGAGAAEANVRFGIERLLTSLGIAAAVRERGVLIQGAIYDVDTGHVKTLPI